MAEKDEENVSEGLSKPLRRWRKVGEVEDMRRRVWRALRAAEQVMYDEASTRKEVLKAATVVQQTARTYLKIVEADELEERLEAVERYLEEHEKANGY